MTTTYKITVIAWLRTHSWFLLLALTTVLFTSSLEARSVTGVESIAITVSDMNTSIPFYTEVLPFEIVSDKEVMGSEYERLFGVFGLRARIVQLRMGQEIIELIDFIAPEGRPVPVDTRSNDEWFQHVAIIVSDMDAAYAHLRKHDVTHASPAPQRLPDWNKNAGGIEAFYFRDPDGNYLEILAFPQDKGNKRWHEPTDDLFLGIDHTAIVVRDTEEALRFYRDGLGMKFLGESENYGIEQERLNNVFGARLRITSVGAEEGPAIEFLEYLTPGNGRSMPADTKTNDLWQWLVRIRTDSLDSLPQRINKHGGAFVSPGVIDMPDDATFTRAMQVRGPTGHALLIHDNKTATDSDRHQ
jgi:catechol 2,3-dioxygenase-like lactoylglutathione lyase family enzyme